MSKNETKNYKKIRKNKNQKKNDTGKKKTI